MSFRGTGVAGAVGEVGQSLLPPGVPRRFTAGTTMLTYYPRDDITPRLYFIFSGSLLRPQLGPAQSDMRRAFDNGGSRGYLGIGLVESQLSDATSPRCDVTIWGKSG